MAMHLGCLVTAALYLLGASQRSFVDTAPLTTNQELFNRQVGESEDNSVQELENLKHSLGKTLALMKSKSIEFNTGPDGMKNLHANIKEKVDSGNKLIAEMHQQIDSEAGTGEKNAKSRIQTDLEIPAKNIHHTITQESGLNPVITDNGHRRAINPNTNQDIGNMVNKYSSYSGVQYSPLDMAEYVFWTGDEKGVTMAIEEFLQEGLMTREEAIQFLQEIKYSLDYLQTHYTQQGIYSQDYNKDTPNTNNKYVNLNKPESNGDPNKNIQFDLNDLRTDMIKKSLRNDNSDLDTPKRDTSITEDEYEELLEKLRVADFLYTEYSLEEVIYQLSKIMFIQSLTRGSSEAQAALQKFTNFLETEAEEGHISRALEKKVLDVLIAALTDTLTEHPELVQAAREGLGSGSSTMPDGNRLLRKLLKLGTLDNATIKAALTSFKDQGILARSQQEDAQNSKITPIGFGKYKTP